MKICFAATSTTSLRLPWTAGGRRVWEAAVIVRDRDTGDVEHCWIVGDVDLRDADPRTLDIARFHNRHPHYGGHTDAPVLTEHHVARRIERVTRGAHLAGVETSFDEASLAEMLHRNGLCPTWHYYLLDVPTLAAGNLYTHAATTIDRDDDRIAGVITALLPWSPEAVSCAYALTPPAERHTALGAARWARDLYDAITTGIHRRDEGHGRLSADDVLAAPDTTPA